MITNITIKNIKGFDDSSRGCLDLNLLPNKVNLLIAPNGFGKSSLAAAFASLTKNGLRVETENKYKKDESKTPFLSITIDGNTLKDDEIQNTLSCTVINSNIKASSIQKNMGKFSSVTSYLDISDIVVKKNIPGKVSFSYKYDAIKKTFGQNGKLLPNISRLFEEDKFVELLLKCKDSFDKIISTKNRSALIDEIVTAINEKTGTADKIKSEIDNGVFSQLKNDDQYSRICDLLNSDGFADDSLDEFLVIYQTRIQLANA